MELAQEGCCEEREGDGTEGWLVGWLHTGWTQAEVLAAAERTGLACLPACLPVLAAMY